MNNNEKSKKISTWDDDDFEDENQSDNFFALESSLSQKNKKSEEKNNDVLEMISPKNNDERIKIIRKIADNADYVVTKDDQVYAITDHDSATKAIALRSQDFKFWLISKYEDETGDINIQRNVFMCICDYIEAKARKTNKKCDMWVRVGKDASGTFYHDLANGNGQVIEINKHGWDVVSGCNEVIFKRNQHILELPLPLMVDIDWSEDINLIDKFINLSSEKMLLFKLCAIFLLIPNVKYPIMCFYGEKRSGKGTASRLLAKLIDPLLGADGQTLETNERDVLISLNNRHLVIFDNISSLSNKQSDLFCKIQTGAMLSKRALWTNNDVSTIHILRPIVFTSTTNPIRREDLMDRSLLFEFKGLIKSPRADSLIENEMEEAALRIRAAMYCVISLAMGVIDEIPDVNIDFRCSDYVRWGMAFCEVLNIPQEEFLQALRNNSVEQNSDFAEADPLMYIIISYFESKPIEFERTYQATDWIRILKDFCREKDIPHKILDCKAQSFSRALAERKTNLEKCGIEFIRGKSGKRTIMLRKTDESMY